MSRAQFARMRSLEAATEMLSYLGPGAVVLAGGQELMPSINYRVLAASVFVDINGLPELKGIRLEDANLSIGALCVHREIERNELVRQHAPLLAHALSEVGGGWQVRNRGTIGGNIVCMHPLYDALPALIALEASLLIRQQGESNRVPINYMVTDTGHGLGSTSILVRILVPILSNSVSWGYHKLKTTHGAYSSATAASLVTIDSTMRVRRVRLVLGAVEGVPRDISNELQSLIGKRYGDEMLRDVESLSASAVVDPISDQRGEAGYRRAMAGVSARRAFADAVTRACPKFN
jgi:aerobic carbon-monoxide dehydrogenase medium subunit